MKRKISLILIMLVLIISILGSVICATEIQPRVTTDETTSTDTDNGVMPITSTPISDTPEEEGTNTEDDIQYDITYNDLYVFEDSDYEMNQLIDGNAYIFVNGDVKFTGEVNGSVFIFANGTVEFTKESLIYDSLYIFAQDIKIDGKVYDVYSFSENFETMANAYINRDIRVAADNVKLRGFINRDIYLNAENIDVKDEQSSLYAVGAFNYTSRNEIENLKDIVNEEQIHFNKEEEIQEEVPTLTDRIREYATSAISSIIYVLAIYFILSLIAPKFVERAGKDLKEKGIVALGVGILTWIIIILAIIMSIVLLFTGIAYPISIIMWFAIILAIYISSAVLSISILEVLKNNVENIKNNKALQIGILAVIALVLWAAQQISYVSTLFTFIILTIGIGLIVRNIVELNPQNKDVEI